jgi:hypothetical protein
LTDHNVPANIGISIPPYKKIDKYRYINVFVTFEQESFDEPPVDLGLIFAFDGNGLMGARRYVNLEENVTHPQSVNFISVSGEGTWHGSPHNKSSYIARCARARAAFSYMVGVILSRRIIPFLGRKKSVMGAIIAMGLFSLIYLVVGSFIVALVSSLMVCFFAGVYQSASQGLNLEQLPDLRGPMMSMVSAFQNIGNVISISISGFLLVLYGWNALGGLVVLFSIIGSLILNFYAVETD